MKLLVASFAAVLAGNTASAWSVAPTRLARDSSSFQSGILSSTRLFNVPPPSMDDPVAVKKASDREAPPSSFFELQANCARAAKLAMADGHKLIEVEVRPDDIIFAR